MAVRILGINGSIRAGSSAGRAMQFAFRALERTAAQCESFEIGSLPVLDGRSEDQYPASVSAWRAAAGAADGLLVVVPSFHGAIPGGLKNALDFLGVNDVAGKPFSVIGIAAGDAEPGVTDTTRVLRHIGGVAATPDVVISRSGEHWGAGDEPTNTAVAAAIEKVAADLAALGELRAQGRLPQP